MVRSPLENGASWRFKRLLLMTWLVFHGNVSPISFSQWEQDSNLLGSNVVLGKPHPRDFEDAEMKHTYLDERSTTITKVVPPGRGCSIALKEWLTPAISPNVGNSTSSFLLVGICVRANPYNLTCPCSIWVDHFTCEPSSPILISTSEKQKMCAHVYLEIWSRQKTIQMALASDVSICSGD